MSRSNESVVLQSVVNTIAALPAQSAPAAQESAKPAFVATAFRPLRPNLYAHLCGVLSREFARRDAGETPDFSEVNRELRLVARKFGMDAARRLRHSLEARAIALDITA